MPAPHGSDTSDARFDALAETAPDAIITIDERSTILSANPATERIFGYTREEIVGRPLSILIPGRMRAAHEAGIARYLRTAKRNIPWTGVELPALTKDGRELPVEISFGEFVDASGRRVFSGFIRDVSERVRHQHELEKARAAAERALADLHTLGRITDVALGQGTYEEMLEELLRRLRAELAVDEATVLLMSDDRRELTVVAHDGPGRAGDEPLTIPMGSGVAGKVAATGVATVIEDLHADESMHTALRHRVRSIAAVPVNSDGVVIGVLLIGTVAQRSFGAADVHLLEVIGSRMAGVLARTRLFEAERRARTESETARRGLADREKELRRANAELESRAHEERALRTLAQSITGAVRIHEVMHQIAEGSLAVSGASGAYVEQVISRDGEVEVVAASGEQVPPIGQQVPYPGSLTEEIIERGEPVFLIRMQGIGAAMAPYLDRQCHGCNVLVVPLRAGNETLGAIVLLRRSDEPPFEHGIVTRIRTLADLASISLQRLLALAESERRRSEAEAAVRSRDEVLSVVSHDLRNPVSTVIMSASLLADAGIPLTDDQRRAQLGVITRSAQRMNRLIQDLLDVARIEGGRLTIACRCEQASALGTEAFESFRSIVGEKGIDFICAVPKNLPNVLVDRDRMLQVLSNYLNNAVKFTRAGGRITLHASVDGEGAVTFAVSDTGPGIPQENLEQVFNRYWQAKGTAHLGSGLGLAIAKGIVEAHRGRVWVESEVGVGSTFFMKLPHARECA